MAEFAETMRDWRRLCDAIIEENQDDGCKDCPLLKFSPDGRGCDAIYSDFGANADWDGVEAAIAAWAAEHPEPVYPTWAEWLTSIGVYPKGWGIYQTPLKSEIPADIAKKLGITPITP